MRRPTAGRASRRCPGSPGRAGATPSRTSAPTGRTSRRSSRRFASWTGTTGAGEATSTTPTAGSATASAGSRPSPAAGSCCRVTLRLDSGRARGGALRRAGRAARRRGRCDLVPSPTIRAAVLDLRRSKGMVLDDGRPDTWSAGSFFTNPVVERGGGRPGAGRTARGTRPRSGVKLSAAWLIENAGFGKGFALAPGGSRRHLRASTRWRSPTAAEQRPTRSSTSRGTSATAVRARRSASSSCPRCGPSAARSDASPP